MNHTPESQEEAFALLAEPATHGGAAVKRIDTHAASVFLAGQRVLKVKRAVRFPFLDYSTLAKRKAACEAELAVNQPFAPEIYRRVVPITREADGKIALDGRGEPVEFAVEMRRFDEDATLDRLAEAGKIDAELADALGRAVAAAHATAPAVEAEPWIAALADYVVQNDAAFRAKPDLFAPDYVEALATARRAAHARVAPLLRALTAAWSDLLVESASVRERPAPAVWSPLEYGCHVRDVFELFHQRLLLMLTQDEPLFPNWDQDATAVEARYGEQDPHAVAGELLRAGETLAAAFGALSAPMWLQTGRRSDGAFFTVESFARYLIHDPVHHLHDVGVAFPS